MPQQFITDKITKDEHKLLGLDHLRALAITFVFFFHYRLFAHPAWEDKICGFGWTGVDLFFVLSGFLIAGQLFSKIAKGKHISLREFFLKRTFRIIPAYVVIVLLYLFFPVLRESGQPAPAWRYLTFTFNIWLDRSLYNTFTHAWSLCVEEQFYLVLPAIIVLCTWLKVGKKAAYILIALFIAGFVIRIWTWNTLVQPVISSDGGRNVWLKYIYYPTYTRLDGLLIGVGIAGLFTFYPKIKVRLNPYGNTLLAAGAIVLIGSGILCADQATFAASVFGYPLIALGYGLVVAGAVCPSCALYKFKSWVTAQLATLSYSIYLSHKIVLHVTQLVFGKSGIDVKGNLMFIICIVSTIAGALLLRYMVEKPFLSLRDSILARWKNKKGLTAMPEITV
jgi:peptidoglycan/LPS O-acetylase OafA/YrhL